MVLAAWEPRTGACGSLRDVLRDARANHRVEVVAGVRAEESRALLTEFFERRRGSGTADPAAGLLGRRGSGDAEAAGRW